MSCFSRLQNQTSSATLTDNQYAYNTANQINQIAELTNTKNFGYDNVDRLTSMNNGTANESYNFDGVGNRTSSHLSTSYNYQPLNRVTSTQTASFVYDANGNMVSKKEKEYKLKGDFLCKYSFFFGDILLIYTIGMWFDFGNYIIFPFRFGWSFF